MSAAAQALTVYTVGHSNHALEAFLELLGTAGITAIADVRSAPYSRRNPQFNREKLTEALKENGAAYVYLGDALGGRPQDPTLWRGPRPDYERIAKTEIFCEGLGRIETGAAKYALALMCAEKEPLDCHRCVLIARSLAQRNIAVKHLLAGGALETHAETEQRLLSWAKLNEADMFSDKHNLLTQAYQKRADWLWGLRPSALDVRQG